MGVFNKKRQELHQAQRNHLRAQTCFVFGYALLVAAVLLITYCVPRPGSDVAVLVSPLAEKSYAATIVAQAGGRLVSGARWPFIVIASADSPGFSSRLYSAGAVLVFNPGIAAGCLNKD